MRRVLLALLLLLTLATSAFSANTHGNPNVPELGAWMGEATTPFVASGCLPTVPSSSLTFGAFACTGYVRGSGGDLVYVSQAAATLTLANTDGVHWVALHRDPSTAVSSWTRRAGSHYLFQQVTAQPADPSGGLIVAQVTVAGGVITAVADWRKPASYAHSGVYDVTDALYGAVDDDTTNARTAIAAAIAAASQRGGTVYFPYTRTGSYYISGTGGSISLPVPASTADFLPANETFTYQFYVASVTGLRFKGDGVTLRSDFTGGGEIFLFNGVRDFVWDGITLKSVHTYDASGGNLVTGMNALAFTSTTQDAERILIQNYRSDAAYTAVYVFGSLASAYRVRGMTLQNVLVLNNSYGLAFHDNGYNVDFSGVRTVGGLRSYFIYGVYGHDGQIIVDQGTPNVQNFNAIMLKAYDVNTENITLKVHYNRASTSTKVGFESQHNVAAQATPARVRNIALDYNEQGFAGGGGVYFAYYQDAVLQATSSVNLFDNITLRGVFENNIVAGTVQGNTVRGKLNIADVVYLAGSPTILNAQGFYTTAYRTYTPELKIGGATTGITYSSRVGEFYESGNLVFGNARLTLSSKGALTGSVTVTLPWTLGAYSSNNVVVNVMAYDNFSGLTGVVQGFVNTGTNSLTLLQTSATGKATLNQANLTDTSDLITTFAYPK